MDRKWEKEHVCQCMVMPHIFSVILSTDSMDLGETQPLFLGIIAISLYYFRVFCFFSLFEICYIPNVTDLY